MRSPVLALIAMGMSAGCQAFLAPILPSALTNARCSASVATQGHSTQQRWRRTSILRMSEGEEKEAEEVVEAEEAASPATPKVEDMMEAAKETDYVARAQSAAPSMVGPAMQPEEDRKKEKQEAFELQKPEKNRWASGAFQRGVALQAVVLAFVLFLQFQPEEVGNLAICAPFAKGGCVGFVEWCKIVFLGAPIPPM